MTEMTCGEMEAAFSRLLDGEIEPRERVRIEAHLGRCARCRELFAELERADERARAAIQTLRARPRFAGRVLAAIDRRRFENRRRARSRLVRLAIAGALAAAAAALLLVLAPAGPASLDAKPALLAGRQVETLDENAWRTGESGRATILLASGRGTAYLGPATEARFTEDGAELDGEASAAYFDIEPGRGRYIVRAGDVRVEVLGTKFAVERGAGGVRVAVLEGRVAVTSPAGEAMLAFSEAATFSKTIARDASFDTRAYAPEWVAARSLASPWPEPAGSARGANATSLPGPAGPRVEATSLPRLERVSAKREADLRIALRPDGSVLAKDPERIGDGSKTGTHLLYFENGSALVALPLVWLKPTDIAADFVTPTNLTGLMRPAIGPGGHVFGASRDGYLLAFSPEGKELRRDRLGASILFPPSAAPDGSVWCASGKGAIWRAASAGGKPARIARLGSAPSAPLVTDGKGRAFIALADGRLLALDSSGKTLWTWKVPDGPIAALAIGRGGRLVAASASGALWAITNQ